MSKEKLSVKREHKGLLLLLLPLFSLLIFIGCQNPVSPAADLAAPQEGKGSFTLSLSSRARTILPDTPVITDFAKYNLAFTPTSGGSAVNADYTNASPETPISISLEPGTYKLVVKAYLSGDKLAAEGTLNSILIEPGKNTNGSVALNALLSGGQGTFTWDITLPDDVISATMAMGGETVDLRTSASGSRSLSSGLYNLTFDLKKTNETVVWKELLYVYQNLESRHPFQFTNAHFSNPNYTVTYKYNDNNSTSDKVQSVLHGNTSAKPDDPTRTYYSFGGWYTNEGLTQAFAFGNAVTANLTLYAKWNPVIYTVTFNANGGTGTPPAHMTVQAGPDASIILPSAGGLSHPSPGYTFAGWNTASNGGGIAYITGVSCSVTDNATLFAIWEYNPVEVAFNNLTANGTAGSSTTTLLTLTFDKAIPGLAAGDITLSGNTGAIKGTLTGTGPVYQLTINGITAAGQVTVSVSKAGYAITPVNQNVNVYFYAAPETTTFISLTADGSDFAATTKLILTFSKDITGLTATDITLNSGSTGANKGTLTRVGTGVYELSVIGITADGNVTVTVSKDGYTINSASKNILVSSDLTFTLWQDGLTQNGSPTKTTTKIIITLNKDIPGLDNITNLESVGITGLGGVRYSVIYRGSGVYELPIGGITSSGEVGIKLVKDDYSYPSSTTYVYIPVYYYSPTIAVSFQSLTADGSDSLNPATTTKLTLQFEKDIIGFGLSDITTFNVGNTGATIEALNKTGTGKYELALSGITASGQVTVGVTKAGYAIDPPSKVVVVHYYAPSVSTEGLNITFAQIADSAPSIASGITLYRNSGNGRQTSATFSVANPSQYSITPIWYINGKKVVGNSITVHSMNYDYYSVGEHFLTLEVVRNGRTYSKRVTFNIAN